MFHREYANQTSPVYVDIFNDCVEITSPGILPEPMTLEILEEEHTSHPRNPQIARIFYLYNYVEKVGSGIQRMRHAIEKAGLPPEETYTALPSEEHRRLARTLFGRLIDLGATQQDTTSRRAELSEFWLPDPRQTQLLQETMDAFIIARLLTTNEVGGTITVEISHEALIREWPRCTQWIQETHEDLPFQQTLSKDVARWEQLGRPKERLYRASQLKTTKRRIGQNLLNRQEIRFLHASVINQRLQRIKMVALVLLPMIIMGLILTPVLWKLRMNLLMALSLTYPDLAALAQPFLPRSIELDRRYHLPCAPIRSHLPQDPSPHSKACKLPLIETTFRVELRYLSKKIP